jgi:hypothetical protein
MRRIKEIEKRIIDLENSLWELKNPPRFKFGDKLKFYNDDARTQVIEVEILSSTLKTEGYFMPPHVKEWRYLVKTPTGISENLPQSFLLKWIKRDE